MVDSQHRYLQARLEAASEGSRAGPDEAALQAKQADIQAKLPA